MPSEAELGREEAKFRSNARRIAETLLTPRPPAARNSPSQPKVSSIFEPVTTPVRHVPHIHQLHDQHVQETQRERHQGLRGHVFSRRDNARDEPSDRPTLDAAAAASNSSSQVFDPLDQGQMQMPVDESLASLEARYGVEVGRRKHRELALKKRIRLRNAKREFELAKAVLPEEDARAYQKRVSKVIR